MRKKLSHILWRAMQFSVGFIVLLMVSAVSTGIFVYSQEDGSPASTDPDCALVFGSAVYGWNTPGPAMLRRVSTAVRLYHQEGVKKLIFTGGKTNSTDQSEAQVMAQYARRQNIPTSAMALEEEAQSTWENLEYSKPLVEGCDQVIAISDGYHLGRIRFTAFLLGWGSLPTLPSDEEPPRSQHLRSVLREIGAIGYYLIGSVIQSGK